MVSSNESILYRKFSRRQAMKGMGLIAVGAIFAACAPPPPPTPTPAPAKPAAPAPAPTTAPAKPAAAAATATPAPAKAPAAFVWNKYAGTKITALFTNNPQGQHIKTVVPEFEQRTGIKVDFQILETQAMRDKQNIEFAAAGSSIDVWHSFPSQEGVKYARAGWYEPLKPYLDNPALTAPDYDPADFKALRIGEIKGQLVGIPLWTEIPPLYYNKEHLQNGGVAVPKTMDELEQAAKKLHQPDKEIYGWTMRGASLFNTGTMPPIFYSMGAKWIDANGKAALNSPEAIAALDWYGRMLRLYGPPAADTLDFTRASDLFKAGKVALYMDSPSFIGTFIDKEKSAVAGKFDITVWPAGPAGSRPYITSWIMCIGKFSKNKEAAWYYAQWNTTKEAGLLMAQGTGLAPSRTSVLKSPEYKEFISKTTPAMIEVVEHGLANGVPDLFPPVDTVQEARQIWGDALVGAIQGKDVKALADEANRKLQALLDKEK